MPAGHTLRFSLLDSNPQQVFHVAGIHFPPHSPHSKQCCVQTRSGDSHEDHSLACDSLAGRCFCRIDRQCRGSHTAHARRLLGVGYAVLEDQNGHLDVVGGVKVWSVETDISFNGGLLAGVEREDSATWVDAVVGLRGNYFFTPEIYLTGWGLVGGGGADVDWDVGLGLGYKFNDTISAVAGYRALGVNYENDGFVFDVVQQGPIVGVSFHF